MATQIAAMRPGEQTALASRLRQVGGSLIISEVGNLITVVLGPVTVNVQPNEALVRRTEGKTVELYERGRLAATIVGEDGRLTITRGRTTEVWGTVPGGALVNGRALTPPFAPLVPGEMPRLPWTEPPVNHLRLPRYSPGEPKADFVRAVDQAVERAGGQVIEPGHADGTEADYSNCHAHTFTGDMGDLRDPFMRTGQPRWLLTPLYQLAHGGWARLADTQRVHPGDVVLYRDARGEVTHTGIVRAVDPAGNPSLVESRFGAWGVYLHRPHDVHPQYGEPVEFYRR